MLKVTIKKWKSVSYWKWDVPTEDVCGICRSPYEYTCPDCKIPGDDCSLISGECQHVFHLHCLLKWLQTDQKQQCPMDRQPWKTKT